MQFGDVEFVVTAGSNSTIHFEGISSFGQADNWVSRCEFSGLLVDSFFSSLVDAKDVDVFDELITSVKSQEELSLRLTRSLVLPVTVNLDEFWIEVGLSEHSEVEWLVGVVVSEDTRTLDMEDINL